MGASFDLAGADAGTVAALRTYAADWRTVALAAVPADRPAAEAAVTELYERAHLAAPPVRMGRVPCRRRGGRAPHRVSP